MIESTTKNNNNKNKTKKNKQKTNKKGRKKWVDYAKLKRAHGQPTKYSVVALSGRTVSGQFAPNVKTPKLCIIYRSGTKQTITLHRELNETKLSMVLLSGSFQISFHRANLGASLISVTVAFLHLYA